MSKARRVLNIVTGLFMIFAGLIVFLNSTEASMRFILFIIQIGMTFRGIGALYYYLTMARHMVGGKRVLYRAMIFLDLGILAGNLEAHPTIYAIAYMAAIHAFSGLVSVLRANEARQIKGRWRLKMAVGITELLIAVLVTMIAIGFGRVDAAVYVYGAGLMYSAGLRIAQAFRRTDIVYIQ